jgi:hypothetical protein
MAKAEVAGELADLGKLGGRYVTLDGEMVAARLQVLAERQDVAADRGEVAKDRRELVASSPKPSIKPVLV